MTMPIDRQQFDREQKASWARAAERWGRRHGELREQTGPVASWLVDAIDPQPGQQLLELAAGPGDTGFQAAQRVGPTGTLISSDQATEMVDLARAGAAELGLTNVEFRVLDAQQLDLADDCVDAVLCRFGYMLMADRQAALRETHRVLRPGGRLALATWDTPDRNMWMAAPVMALASRGAFDIPDPDTPTPFSMADHAQVASALEQAGFSDIDVQRLEYVNSYRDFAHYWDLTLDLAAPVKDALSKLDEPAVAEVREGVHETLASYEGADGLSVPATAVVARAKA